MARRRKSRGGRRGKALNIMTVAKAAPALIGTAAALKQVYDSYSADNDFLHATTGLVVSGSKVSLDRAVPIGIVAKVGGGIVASKVVGAILNKVPAPAKRVLAKIHA